MLKESDRGAGNFPFNEIRAAFYEAWGDALTGDERMEKYEAALANWEMWASYSTSGGEGTARMMEVRRVRGKLDRSGGESNGS